MIHLLISIDSRLSDTLAIRQLQIAIRDSKYMNSGSLQGKFGRAVGFDAIYFPYESVSLIRWARGIPFFRARGAFP